MFVETIVFIILFIVAIIVIASASYSSDGMPEVKTVASKTLTQQTKSFTTALYEHNCYIYNIDQINSNVAYIISGEFERSCVSIYLDGERIHSREISGSKSLVFSSNLNLTSQLFKLTRYKSVLLPLELGKSYTIVFNNVNELDIKEYKVAYNIDYKSIEYDYTLGVGTNEYDIYQLIKNDYPSLTRAHLKNGNKENMWIMNGSGEHLIIIPENIYNLDIDINGQNYNTKNSGQQAMFNILNITDPNITIYNLDFITKIKDINQEYLDFITSPNYLMNKFIYGSKTKKSDFISQVNNKIIIYKLA
jgi:hypothetical protein